MRVSDAEDAAAAAHDVGDAAGVRHREGVGHGEGGVQPVVVGLGAAARQLDKCVCAFSTWVWDSKIMLSRQMEMNESLQMDINFIYKLFCYHLWMPIF